MPADIVTNNIAEICLATGCAALCDGPSGIMLAGPGFAIPVRDAAWEEKTGRDFGACTLDRYMSEADFVSAAKAVSESIAEASLRFDPKGYETYLTFLRYLESIPMTGRVVLSPIQKAWPDAMESMIPWKSGPLAPAVPVHDRIFPLVPRIDAIAMELDDGTDIPSWCEANPGLLACDGDAVCGWCSHAGRVSRVCVETVDFRKPWRIVEQPDGSEVIASAMPLVLKSPMLSYYEPDLYVYENPKRS